MSFIIVVFILLVSCITPASAEVLIYDDVVPVGKTVKLNAVTKGRFFIEGGRLVTFYADGNSLGSNLSGGDGYAFLNYTPSSAGTFTLKAESGADKDEATLLVTAKTDRILLIEIETVFVEFPFSFKPAEESTKALQRLSRNYRILYITAMAGTEASEKVIRENSFPVSPVFKWEGAEFLDGLKEKGILPYAIVASAGVISDAMDIANRYSFEETETATSVKDWDDLLKKLELKKAIIVHPDN
ncbi:MAG: hypothetical protein AB1499_13265 [Nitrospirota bacterium]